MRKHTLLALPVLGLWWVMLLPSWISTAGSSLSGTELNRTLAVLPPVVILLALISLYGRMPRSLLTFAALLVATASVSTLFLDFAGSVAVINLQEKATGLVGGYGEIERSVFPTMFAVTGIVGTAALLWAGTKRLESRHSTDRAAEDSDDPRNIWDEQA